MKRFLKKRGLSILGSGLLLVCACYLAYAFSTGITGQTRKSSLTAGCGIKVGGGSGCHGSQPDTTVQVRLSGPTALPVGTTGTYTITLTGASTSGGGCDIAVSSGTLGVDTILLQVLNQELTHVSPIATPYSVHFTYVSNSPGAVTMYANGKTSKGWNWAPDFSFRIGPPPAPSLVLPANGSSAVPTSVTLIWTGIPGPKWTLDVSTAQAFSAVVLHKDTLSDTAYVVPTGVIANNTQYYWRVSASDSGGVSAWSPTWSFTTALTGVKEVPSPLPAESALLQNYPNPFNPTTVVSSQLSAVSNVKLVIYDMIGREVAVLVNERRTPGVYHDTFDGSGLASGIYIYRMTAGPFMQTRQMVLLK